MKILSVLGTVFVVLSMHAAPLPLTAPAAPFVRKTEVSPAAPVKGKLDTGELAFLFGSKKIMIDPSGTFTVISEGRKIADSYFCASTPAKSWNTNIGKKVIGKYDGTGICVLECTPDVKAGTVKIRGMLGFNAPGTPEEAYPWERTFSLTKDNKILVTTVFSVPKGKLQNSKCGVFFSLFQTNDYTVKPVDRGDARGWHVRTADITVDTKIPEDSFTIQILNPMMVQDKKRNTSIYLTPESYTWKFVIDPGQCGKEQPRLPGGVDFKRNDDFVLPTTGKNLLPNPYFAQGTAFVKDSPIFFWFTSPDPVLRKGDAKFGQYSLNPGQYYSATIPADAGNYVFSIYAKGKGTLSLSASSKAPWRNVDSIRHHVESEDWQRFEFPFNLPKAGMLCIAYSFYGTGAMDGIQLEKGSKATKFSAPEISARLVTDPADGFFESGKKVSGHLKLSTLEKSVSGKGSVTIRNFFGETVRSAEFDYHFKAGEYPEIELPLDGLDDGIYVIEASYTAKGSRKKHVEHFRVSVMPFLKNEHFTRKMFSPVYDSASVANRCNPKYFERWMQIGYGTYGHAGSVRPEGLAVMKRTNTEVFDGVCVSRAPSAKIAQYFPDLKVPEGHVYFYVKNYEAFFNDFTKDVATCPDYRLVGGWSEAYRQRFKAAVKAELRKGAEAKVYSIGSEWPAEIKDDPHYPDLVNAYFEAVREIFPNAKVAEGGGMNMHPHDGVRQVDVFLERFEKRGFRKPDYLFGHPYCGDTGISQVFGNFKALLKVAEKHKMSDCKLAFPEGMHFYPYDIPEWGCRFCSAQEWRLRGAFSYDLGWIERLGAAYIARFYLVHMTEFNRVECVTSAIQNTNNFILDTAFVPRASQKVTNTLGNLFPHPKRYIGDFSFAPETKCLIWEDHEGRPIAAVWNENEMVNKGLAPSPMARTSYTGAEYIDLMGAPRRPIQDGDFPVSPFPLFIRGKKGDCDAFVKALRSSVIRGSEALPFRLSEKISGDGKLELTLGNDLSCVIKGTLTVGVDRHEVALQPGDTVTFRSELPDRLSDSAVKVITVPLVWNDGKNVVRRSYSFSAFLVRPFRGTWDKVPSIRLTNRTRKRAKDDFEASFQLAWSKKALHLRITVKDNMLTAGTGSFNRYDFDSAQIYIDAMCSARKNNKRSYDDDDYDYTLMPTPDGKGCEIFRALSPFMQYTLGTAAPKDNTIVKEFSASFTRTENGYVYETAIPAPYVRPVELVKGWNMGFGLLVSDRDNAPHAEQCLSLSTVPGKGCHNAPHTWPIAVFTDR